MFEHLKIKQELKKLNIPYSKIDLIQNKDGVIVARIQSAAKSYIIKYFQNEDFKREIKNYQLLDALNIPAVKVFGFTDSAILMEDVSQSNTLRLSIKEDLDDIVIASKIAEWYKLLHTSNAENITELYDETVFITRENIELLKKKPAQKICLFGNLLMITLML